MPEARRGSKSVVPDAQSSNERHEGWQTAASPRSILKHAVGDRVARPILAGRTQSAPHTATQGRTDRAAAHHALTGGEDGDGGEGRGDDGSGSGGGGSREGKNDASRPPVRPSPSPIPIPAPMRSPALSASSASPTTPRSTPVHRRFPARSNFPRLPIPVHTEQDPEKENAPDPIPEVNIAVLGDYYVGKTSFIQKAFDLPIPPPSPIVARTLSLDGITYSVRLLEISLDSVDVNIDGGISWPERVRDIRVPRANGVITLYDVGCRQSFDKVPQMLTAFERASLPSMLVSSKCDIESKQLDPGATEQRVQGALHNIRFLQTDGTNSEAYKDGISLMVRNIVSSVPAPTNRRRTISSARRPLSSSSRIQTPHARANSEFSLLRKDVAHGHHDSSATIKAPQSNTASGAKEDGNRGSYTGDESHESGYTSATDSTQTASMSEDDPNADAKSDAPSDEKGYTFDSLVDRLLLLPKSKADGRYAAIFLALYRKFAAPGQLLEAIVYRFELLETENVVYMSRIVAQLRYLSIIEQWIGTYPGDFAHPVTKRRMRTFVAKLAETRIFTAAAREMSSDLDMVGEDDDTDWACCDKDRERSDTIDTSMTWSSRASTLLDDPAFEFSDNLGNLSLTGSNDARSSNVPLPSNYGLLHSVEAARKQAQSLTPVPRTPVDKDEWRKIMDTPADVIAKELTRIDWIMFSAIRPRDLIRQVSLSKTQKSACRSLVNVNRMIEHFNHLRDWVANYILLRDKAKHRVMMLEKLMLVARKLRDLNNYNSLGAFIAGINSAAVTRLSATKDLLPPDIGRDWMKLEVLMAHTRSYSTYRLAWENSSDSRIPFLPLPIRDLVGAEEGNKTFVDENKERINWKKFEVMGDTIVGIQKAQGLPYKELKVGAQEELRARILNNASLKDDEELYERSCQVEPTNSSSSARAVREFFKRG